MRSIFVLFMIKLFVGGFPLDITELELVKLFGPHADISTIKIVRDKKTRVCKGYAFVEIIDKDGVDRAIEALDGTAMGDKVLSVKITEEKQAAPKKSFSRFSGNSSQPSYSKVERTGAAADFKKKRPRKQF